MIKIKYKILNETDSRVELFVLYEDNTFTVLNLAQDTLANMLKNAYILTSNAANRLPYVEETPTDFEAYNITPVATTLKTDFNNLTGKVYDQYGLEIDLPIEFSIEGTDKVRIENGRIIEDIVEEDVSYFIVAKYGDLEERQKRTIYAPREVEPSEIDILNNEIEELKQTIDIMLGGKTVE